ncbi:MAG: hypothetical protein ABTD50_17055 [Polyangiaceae bacterium]
MNGWWKLGPYTRLATELRSNAQGTAVGLDDAAGDPAAAGVSIA